MEVVKNGAKFAFVGTNIDREYLYEYGFFDGKYVEVKVNRLDFYFD